MRRRMYLLPFHPSVYIALYSLCIYLSTQWWGWRYCRILCYSRHHGERSSYIGIRVYVNECACICMYVYTHSWPVPLCICCLSTGDVPWGVGAVSLRPTGARGRSLFFSSWDSSLTASPSPRIHLIIPSSSYRPTLKLRSVVTCLLKNLPLLFLLMNDDLILAVAKEQEAKSLSQSMLIFSEEGRTFRLVLGSIRPLLSLLSLVIGL